MKKLFCAYARVSDRKQEPGASLSEQQEEIRKLAAKLGVDIMMFEEVLTAAKHGRPVFTKMIQKLQRGEFDGVIFHKIDRSARNYADWSQISELMNRGVPIYFAKEGFDLNTRGGRLIADIEVAIAIDYIRNLREEIKKGMYGRLRQGVYPFRAPIGYRDTGAGKPKELDRARAPLVQLAFERYATGTYTLHTLRAELTRRGLTNHRGSPLSVNSLDKMLNNPFYTGLMRVKTTGETFPGTHPPIISTTLFHRVQDILHGRFNARVQTHNFLFRRLIVCAGCQHSLRGELQKGRVYYRCHERNCPTTCLREDAIEGSVVSTLQRIQLSDAEKVVVRRMIVSLTERWRGDVTSQAQALTLRIQQVKERLNRLTDTFLDRLIEKDAFQERREALLFEQRGLEEQLAKINERAAAVPARVERTVELAITAYLTYCAGGPEIKRQILSACTSNRIARGKNIVLEALPPFDDIEKRPENAKSGHPWEIRRIWAGLMEKLVQFAMSNDPPQF